VERLPSNKIFLLLSGLAVLIFLVVVQFGSSKPDGPQQQLTTVQPMSFDVQVNTVGVLEAERSHTVSSTIKGDRGKIISIIEDGSIINAGDILVRFDATPFEAEIHRLTGELKSREAVVEGMKQLLEWEKSQAEGAVNNAEFDLKDVNQEYNRYLAYIKDLEALEKKGFSYPTEIYQARKKAEQLLAKREKALTDIDKTKKESAFKVAAAFSNLGKVQSELETTRTGLQDAKTEIGKTVVKAPFPGIAVLHEFTQEAQRRKPRVGDTIWQNQPLLYLPDISSMRVKTYVREIDLHKIHAGQKALIRVDAYPQTQFEGVVRVIGALATDSIEGIRGEKHFQVVVNIVGTDLRLRPGMTARVFIQTARVKDVLSVPIQAIFQEGGRKYVYLYGQPEFKKTEVTLGRQNEDDVEILSGLRNGERISLVKPKVKEIQ
jgi:HlyD family secretion protein